MKISRIETIPFAIPYRKPLRFASGAVTAAEHVLVRVHTDDGLTGTAEAPPRPYTYGETQASVVAVMHQLFAPAITGLSPLDREAIHTRLNQTVGNPTAKAAIDMAAWDVIGQALGVPVAQLLGGYTDRMRVAHMLGFPGPPPPPRRAPPPPRRHGRGSPARPRRLRHHDVQDQGRTPPGRPRPCRL